MLFFLILMSIALWFCLFTGRAFLAVVYTILLSSLLIGNSLGHFSIFIILFALWQIYNITSILSTNYTNGKGLGALLIIITVIASFTLRF